MSSLFGHRAAEQQHVVLGYQVAGLRIFCIATLHSFLIGNSIFHLTPTEYQVACNLLHQRERWERGQAPLWTSFTALSQLTDIADVALLNKHVRNASNKLTPMNIGFVLSRTQSGNIYQTVVLNKDISKKNTIRDS